MTENEEAKPARRKTPGAFHHGDLADALVASASELIVARGAAGFSLREVAEKVGVSHAAAYRHFKGKTDLLAEIAVRGFAALQEILDASVVAGDDGRPDIRRSITHMGDSYIGFAVANPGAYRVLFHPDLCDRSLYPLLAEAATAAFLSLAAIIGAGQSQGLIHNAAPAEVLASALWAAQHGHASLLLDQQIHEGGLPREDIPPADRTVLLDLMISALFAKG